VNQRRLILFLYGVVLTGLIVWAGAVFFESQAEYRQLKETQAGLQRRLAEARARLAEQERNLERLKNDPDYVEKVVRRRLHYVKPGETIYWFPD
jgi:cell division protein DivIC